MQSFLVQSSHNLQRILEKLPVSAPPRGRRTREHSQQWVIRQFLLTVAESELLEYPLYVEPGDRPDFVLSSPFWKLGIEITEAVPQERARVEALDETTVSNPDARFDPPYRYGEKRSLKKIRDIARNRDRTQYLPHMGDSTERNWIEAMMCITKHKTRKLALPGFSKHLGNWLLIYDNWSPAIHESHRHHVAEPLAQQLYNGGWRNPFEKILILRGTPAVWEFSHNAKKMNVHDPSHSGLERVHT